jgi:hypothetical protein
MPPWCWTLPCRASGFGLVPVFCGRVDGFLVDLANSSLTPEADEMELEVVADPVRVGPCWRPLFLASEAVCGLVNLVAAAALIAASRATSCAAAHAMASWRLLDLGRSLTMKESSLVSLTFLFFLWSLPMVKEKVRK